MISSECLAANRFRKHLRRARNAVCQMQSNDVAAAIDAGCFPIRQIPYDSGGLSQGQNSDRR